MVILNAIKQLIGLNYRFVADKFKVKLGHTDTNPEIETLEAFFTKRKVLNGIFKGLRYVDFNSVCSAIYPKLLGSYEWEIQQNLQAIVAANPPLIIDIGCAEGYYAVGLARLLPASKVIAADTSAEARKLCRELASFNECTNITVTGAIDAATLTQYDLKNALIICDCEGYEKQLFIPKIIPCLQHTTLIIETHDFIDPSISKYLEELFGKTHQVEIVSSIDDLQKVKYYNYPELEHFNYREKKEMLSEYRPAIMEWLILTPLEINRRQ
jgi:hypothetical protein